MSKELKEKFRLYTLAEVAALIPVERGAKQFIEDIATENGCYRAFGSGMYFTEDDIAEVFSLARKTVQRGEPSPATPGWLVWFGSKTNPDADCMLGWTTQSGADAYIKDIVSNTPERVDVLTYFPCTRGDYRKHLKALSKHNSYGYWFYRTKEVNKYIQDLIAAFPMDDGDEESEDE